MAIQQLNRFKGETITFRLIGSNGYIFNGENAEPFIVYVYPDGLDVLDPANQSKVTTIDSSIESPSDTIPYVVRIEGENEVQCFIPYKRTASDNMPAGKYTLEIRYGDTIISVITRNNAFTLVNAYSGAAFN